MRYNRLYKDNNFLTPTTYTQELSEYAVGLKYEDIPVSYTHLTLPTICSV